MASVRAVILHEALLKHLDEVRATLLFEAHPVLQVFVELGWRAHSIAIESARRTWQVLLIFQWGHCTWQASSISLIID